MAASSTPCSSPEVCLRQAFDAYNRQDADALLTMVTDDVSWATAQGLMHGKQELRSYWDWHWQHIRTHDRVVHVEGFSDTMYAVTIEQIIRTLDGDTLSTGGFIYKFILQDRLIKALMSISSVEARD